MDIFLIIRLWLCGRLVNTAFWAALLLQASFLMWFLFLFNMQAVQNLIHLLISNAGTTTAKGTLKIHMILKISLVPDSYSYFLL